jgi:hypothetical protein
MVKCGRRAMNAELPGNGHGAKTHEQALRLHPILAES